MDGAETEALIGGRFRLGDLLGVGGSASVFAAEDTLHDNSAVAVRLLHERLVADADAVEAFLAPARAAQVLSGENIAAVLAVGDGIEQTPWVAVELAAGLSAAERVGLDGALGVSDALAVATGLLRALETVHAAGLVHRDITPGNVMIAGSTPFEPDAVRLIDFGLAAPAGQSTVGVGEGAGQVVGSVLYISPEQARGNPVDARGDIYQVGAVLHFLLTGRAPYPRGTVREVLEAHVGAQPPIASAWNDEVPIAVDRIVTKAMAKTLRYRFATATEMLDAVLAAGERLGDPRPVEVLAATRVFSATAATEAFAAVSRSMRGSTPAYLRPLGSEVRQVARGPRPLLWAAAALVPLVLVVSAIAAFASSETDIVPEPTLAAPVEEAPAATAAPGPSAYVRVPQLGSTLAEAQAALAGAGLTVTVLREPSMSAIDTVLRSDPAVGASVTRGGAVVIVAASGENLVPTVAHLSALAAEEALRSAGFGVATMMRDDPAVPGGSAISSSPSAGETAVLGSTVILYVAIAAAAPTPTPTPVPTSTAEPAVPTAPPVADG